MPRLAPLLAAVLAVAAVVVLRPFGPEPTGACAQAPASDAVVARVDCEAAAAPAQTLESCAAVTQSFRSVAVVPRGRGLRFSFTRRVARPVRVDVFQSSVGRRVVGERLVARFSGRAAGFGWSGTGQRGRRVRDGALFARFSIRDERGRLDVRRVALTRAGGRFGPRRQFYRRTSCSTLTSFKLTRPVFGGPARRGLGIAFRLARAGTVTVELRRASGGLVRRLAASRRRAGVTHRLRIAPGRLSRGSYEVRLRYEGDQGTLRSSLFAQRL